MRMKTEKKKNEYRLLTKTIKSEGVLVTNRKSNPIIPPRPLYSAKLPASPLSGFHTTFLDLGVDFLMISCSCSAKRIMFCRKPPPPGKYSVLSVHGPIRCVEKDSQLNFQIRRFGLFTYQCVMPVPHFVGNCHLQQCLYSQCLTVVWATCHAVRPFINQIFVDGDVRQHIWCALVESVD